MSVARRLVRDESRPGTASDRLKYRLSHRVFRPMESSVRSVLSLISGNPPVLIYTMEKVGTQSILRSVLGTSLAQQAFMAHTVVGSKSRQHKRSVPFDYDAFRRRSRGSVKVITAVREPIARDVSLFFELLPQLGCPFNMATSIDVLERGFDRFVSNELACDYLSPNEWMETEFVPTVGFNPSHLETLKHMSEPRIVEQGDVELLIFRTEDLPSGIESLLGDFLGTAPIDLVDSNRASAKAGHRMRPHYRLYREFCSTAKFRNSYIDRAYNDATVCHFYATSEIEAYKSKWSGDSRSER